MPQVALSQQMMQQLQLLLQREHQPRPVSLADVQQHGVELCQLLAQHQGHLNTITSGEIPPLKALVDGLVAAGVLLARRRAVVQEAMQNLRNSGADVSTLTPLVDLLSEGLTQSTGTLAAITHGAGQLAEQVEEAVGVVDTQVQVQEVIRLAAMWELLQGNQQQDGAQGGDPVAA